MLSSLVSFGAGIAMASQMDSKLKKELSVDIAGLGSIQDGLIEFVEMNKLDLNSVRSSIDALKASDVGISDRLITLASKLEFSDEEISQGLKDLDLLSKVVERYNNSAQEQIIDLTREIISFQNNINQLALKIEDEGASVEERFRATSSAIGLLNDEISLLSDTDVQLLNQTVELSTLLGEEIDVTKQSLSLVKEELIVALEAIEENFSKMEVQDELYGIAIDQLQVISNSLHLKSSEYAEAIDNLLIKTNQLEEQMNSSKVAVDALIRGATVVDNPVAWVGGVLNDPDNYTILPNRVSIGKRGRSKTNRTEFTKSVSGCGTAKAISRDYQLEGKLRILASLPAEPTENSIGTEGIFIRLNGIKRQMYCIIEFDDNITPITEGAGWDVQLVNRSFNRYDNWVGYTCSNTQFDIQQSGPDIDSKAYVLQVDDNTLLVSLDLSNGNVEEIMSQMWVGAGWGGSMYTIHPKGSSIFLAIRSNHGAKDVTGNAIRGTVIVNEKALTALQVSV